MWRMEGEKTEVRITNHTEPEAAPSGDGKSGISARNTSAHKVCKDSLCPVMVPTTDNPVWRESHDAKRKTEVARPGDNGGPSTLVLVLVAVCEPRCCKRYLHWHGAERRLRRLAWWKMGSVEVGQESDSLLLVVSRGRAC
ncbi:hypothetical protein EDB92DRAFT_1817079 [Lactarius akahatsu]|uniref:Uncharacterized protein n=1 Tax=Lactarius akahatsu TaxID=416441 RepID=A0AAD4LEQ2_9AGAM|nr:hypothetical protein EDB92DRAFT_1817079 [Lactarius akahatsu]